MTNEEIIKYLELYRDGVSENELPPHSFDLNNEIINKCITALLKQSDKKDMDCIVVKL